MYFYSSKYIRAVAFAGATVMLGTNNTMAQESFTPTQWPNTSTARVEALAVLQTLNANLLGNTSATLTLDRWCAAHKLAPEGSKILAQRIRGQDKPADGHIRELLAVGPDEPSSIAASA